MDSHPNADICVWPDGPVACEEDPRGCFPCKLRYMSAHGANFQYSYGRDQFHGATIKERQDREVRLARESGNEIRPKSNIYTGGI